MEVFGCKLCGVARDWVKEGGAGGCGMGVGGKASVKNKKINI